MNEGELKRRLVLFPGDAAARLQLAELYFGEADYGSAAEVLSKGPALEGNGRRLLVSAHLRRGMRGAAQVVLQSAARERPGDAAVRDELADFFVDEGRLDDALLALDEADALAPAPARAVRRAQLCCSLRLAQPALAVLAEALQRAPGDPLLVQAQRALQAELGRDPIATALVEREVAAATGRLAEARELLRAGELEKARRALALSDRGSPAFALLRDALKAALEPAGPVAALQREAEQPGLIGVLGWGPRGGAVSPLQAVAVPGRGDLHVTGNVGETGAEAARVAWSCLKARAVELSLVREVREQDLHLHYADTEISKEGASSGLALTLAATSALRRIPLPRGLAATGEITLAGEVRKVAGIHEKLVAAALARMELVLLPRRNLREASELPASVPARVRLVHVDTLSEAAAAVLGAARRAP